MNYTSSVQILFDYEFTRLFKSNEGKIKRFFKEIKEIKILFYYKASIIKAISSKVDSGSSGFATSVSGNSLGPNSEEQKAIIARYKEFIREQDIQLNSYKLKLDEQNQLNQTLVATLKQLEDQFQTLKDQHALLRASSK